MILAAIFSIILSWQLYKTVSIQRRILILGVLAVYLLLTIGDLFYLDHVYGRAFHFSDPGAYYENTKNSSFAGLLEQESSNAFYPVINWVYNHVYSSALFVSFLLKLDNILVFLASYTILTKKLEKINYVDFLMLMNPFLLLIIIRNVRDLYILFIVIVLLISMGVIQHNRLGKSWTVVGGGLLVLIRPVLVLPIMLVYWMKNKYLLSKLTRSMFYVVTIGLIVWQLHSLTRLLGNQMVSALNYINEDTDIYAPLLEGVISPQMILQIISRLFIGLVSFLFTPHPVNFFSEWMATMDMDGTTAIYTGLDNTLIFMGSIVNYLFVLPIIIASLMHYKRLNQYILLYTVIYIIIYVTMFLGVTDIRIRYSAIFLFLFMFRTAQPMIKVKPLHYGITFCIFGGLILLGS